MTELCPNCGEFTNWLNPASGWCATCSPSTCQSCGRYSSTSLCSTCKRDQWSINNADAIERYLATGLTIAKAKQAVADENRPNCLCCGEPINHGNPSRHRFCSRTQLCRTSARRYKYYTRDKRMNPQESLIKVLGLLTREAA